MRSVIVRLNEFYLVDVSGLRVKLAVNVHSQASEINSSLLSQLLVNRPVFQACQETVSR